MNQVLAQYSDRKAILCFHSYIHVQEEMDGLLDLFGVLVRDQVVAKNPNVFAVLNGHYAGASYQTVRFDDNNDGKLDRTVYQICTDYQSAWEGGEEYIKFLYFDLDNDQIYVNSYSPYFDDFNYYDHELRDLTALAASASDGVKWETDMDSYKFTVDFDTNKQSLLANSFSAYLATNEVLGTAAVDEATGTATLRVDGLRYNSNYAWYAELNNAESGYLRTELYEFTTEDRTEYYLFGYINGANYACEEDYQNMGQYRFDENGKLTVTFRQDSYVAVKELDNRNWYMTQQYVTGTEAILYNTNTGVGEKMFVPAHQQVTFTLLNNGDGTLHLSYTAQDCAHIYADGVRTEPTCTEPGAVVSTCQICGYMNVEEIPASGHSYENGVCGTCGEADPDYVKPIVIPTLTLKAPALEFKDMVKVIAFFTADNIEDVVEMGMVTYSSDVSEASIDTADHVIPGAIYEEGSDRYFASSQGINAKYLGDTVYLACYAKLTDGSYVYTKVAPYGAVQYATNQLKNSTDMKLKQLVAAMLNYGAAAQLYFGYNTDVLANASLTDEQIALPESYTADMVQSVSAVDAAKQGIFANNQGFSVRKPAVSFEGAFSINYFFTPAHTLADGITLYYWNEADFNVADVLSVENATGSLVMTAEADGQYRGDITDIAAKNIANAVYVAAVYSDGTTTWTSGVLGYSIGAYCASMAKGTDTMAELAKATAVYGYHAKQYFG